MSDIPIMVLQCWCIGALSQWKEYGNLTFDLTIALFYTFPLQIWHFKNLKILHFIQKR